jgi:hypothetical protein
MPIDVFPQSTIWLDLTTSCRRRSGPRMYACMIRKKISPTR